MKTAFYVRLALMASLAWFTCTTKMQEHDSGAAAPAEVGQPQNSSARPVHWGYEEEDGPENWASLSPAYRLCSEGHHQSPVNIVGADVAGGKKWNFDYGTTSLRIAFNEHMDEIIDNGHTIQITVEEGSVFTLERKAYHLKQFHFHTPSEHTLDGVHSPMEMHLVHQSEDGSLAVVGILFMLSDQPNENFGTIIRHLPDKKGESKHVTEEALALQAHLPDHSYAYHYTGSLTTPPCNENVQWLVLRDPIGLSAGQLEAFTSRLGHNNRPVQALNDRVVNSDDLLGAAE